MSALKAPPALNIPASGSTVTVRVIDPTTSLFLDPALFWQPEIKGLDGITAPALCFLISNGARHVLFDLGVRKDWHNYAPVAVDLIERTTRVKVENDVAEILDSQKQQHGDDGTYAIGSADIEAIILSHHHFDHMGDPSTFPPATELVVGPGVKSHCWPGYPTEPNSLVRDSDIEGRTVREIDFTEEGPATCRVGRFRAFDYFGDGSFYLLDAPGHAVGHLCALARVTSGTAAGADSFVFMGGDAGHHPGLIRPSEYLPLPETIEPSPLRRSPRVCPGKLLQQIHRTKSSTEPFLLPSQLMFPQYDEGIDTLRKIQELDASDNIFIILPHDKSIMNHIDLFPRTINGWMEKGVRNQTRWLFCQDFEGALD